MIRRLKLSYALYNLFHRNALTHNLAPYRKLGLNKTYFAPISSADFVGKDPTKLLVERPIESLSATRLYQGLPDLARASFDAYEETGFGYIPAYLNADEVDRVNDTIQDLQDSGKLDFTYGNKLMFAIRHDEWLSSLWNDPKLLEFLDVLIGGRARLFQSINFLQGSEQATHSDSIHMTTFPLGGLLGVWIALEDIGPKQGPLHYYPGSHKMPYYLNDAYDNEGGLLTVGSNTYGKYEEMIAKKVSETTYKKHTLTANKGDLFVWHANLLHGGEPHQDPNQSRKSMVLHYFDANRACYHEITQRPALFL